MHYTKHNKLLFLFITGEACGEGSLITLRQNATSRGLSYTCYDLYGQANDTTQAAALTTCARMVIDNVQKGRLCKNCNKWRYKLLFVDVTLLVYSTSARVRRDKVMGLDVHVYIAICPQKQNCDFTN